MLAVLVTYHNEGPLLSRCLESLASQGPFPSEVWVYDDASSDPAGPWIDRAQLRPDQRACVRLQREEQNIGPARARNRLARLCEAEYIHFQDADDIFLPGWAACVLRLAGEGSPDLVLTELRSQQRGVRLSDEVIGLRALESHQDLARFALLHAILPAAATYRRQWFVAVGGYCEALWQSEDYELHIRMGLEGARYAFSTEPLVELDVRDASRSQKQIEVWACRLQALELLRGQVANHLAATLAEAYARTGARLAQLGEHRLARQALGACAQLGGATYDHRPRAYRLIARWLGPYLAERLGAIYRRMVPERLRI